MCEWSCVWQATTVALFITRVDGRDDQQLLIGISSNTNCIGRRRQLLPSDAMQALLMPSCGVCPSVRPSRSWILSKQLNVRSVFFHRHHSSFSVMAIFWRGLPSTGASNSGGVGRNRDCLRIAVYRLMTAGRANNTCDNPRCSLSHRHDGSVNLCLSQPAACTTTTKRTERNLFVRNGKSEADIALDVLFCWSYWQTQSIARPLCDGRATCNSL